MVEIKCCVSAEEWRRGGRGEKKNLNVAQTTAEPLIVPEPVWYKWPQFLIGQLHLQCRWLVT